MANAATTPTNKNGQLPPLHDADEELLRQVERALASPVVSLHMYPGLLFDVRWRLRHKDGATVVDASTRAKR